MEIGFFELILHYAVIIGEVALALGLVIFVHELGHFVVAKLCGVKCEKFYLGFDVYGLKLAKFQWGETEYGIGALPLGGYVKMLGQDDNPARAYDEMQRAKLTTPGAAGDAEALATAANPPHAALDGDEPVTLDPRSYMAQSVPKRMAIISAGVIMNLIFAFIFAMIAYQVGIEDRTTTIAGAVPGQPAWKAGLQPGDTIVRIGDAPTPYFSDLTEAITLGDFQDGLQLVIDRPGKGEFPVTMMPDTKLRKIPSIGVTSAGTTRLHKLDRWTEATPVSKSSPAAAAEPPFEQHDEVVSINGTAVATNADILRELARLADQPLTIEVRRHASAAKPGANQEETPQGELVAIKVGVNPIRELGMSMQPEPISAIQAGSPADGKLELGDKILAIDGQPLGDPMMLPSQLDRRAGEKVTIRVERPGAAEPLDFEMELRQPLDSEWPGIAARGLPLSVPSLGIAFPVSSRVAAVTPGGPADAMLIKPGDEIVAAKITVAPKKTGWWPQKPKSDEIKFQADAPSWPSFMASLQSIPDDATIELTANRSGGETRVVPIAPVLAEDWFNPDRGLNFAPMLVNNQAKSLGEAASLALDKTKDNVLMVYKFLRKLKEGQVPATAMGGPIAIAQQAGQSASDGIAHLLMFLVMLSANLAVINFLPIPLLDGGHMVFLALEAIRRKPVSERVVVAFHYAGFLFLISLMCFVLFLDLGGRTWLWRQ